MRKENRNKNNANIGIAGVHYVVSELALRGLIALPTIRNTAGYDIVAATEDGLRHANIQVKASAKPKDTTWVGPGWSKADVESKIKRGLNDYYVLVRRVGENWEAYLLTGQQAYENLLKSCDKKLARGRAPNKLWPEFDTKNADDGGQSWAHAWKEWQLVPR